MYPGDAESKWPRELLTDRRVEHRWDEPKAAGRWFLTNLQSLHPSRGGDGVFPQRVDAPSDSSLLFDRRATRSDTPNCLLRSGYTLPRTRPPLLEDSQFT